MGNVDRYNEFSVGDVVIWDRTYKDYIEVQISDLARFDDFCRAKISNPDTGEDYGWVDVYVLSKKSENVEPDKNHTNSKQLAAAESLRKAASIIEEREKEYGDPTVCFGKIAKGWSLILGTAVKPYEVALMMDWLKTVRLLNDPTKADSWQDKAGYSALGEQLACGKDNV